MGLWEVFSLATLAGRVMGCCVESSLFWSLPGNESRDALSPLMLHRVRRDAVKT